MIVCIYRGKVNIRAIFTASRMLGGGGPPDRAQLDHKAMSTTDQLPLLLHIDILMILTQLSRRTTVFQHTLKYMELLATRTMSSFRSTAYTPRHPSWPYNPQDFVRLDESSDTDFYSSPRFVTHIDDTAIAALKRYYAEQLPSKGKVLDICSSWISHLPPDLEKRAAATAKRKSETTVTGSNDLEVIGMGMNKAELAANPVLFSYHLIDLNTSPQIPPSIGSIDAATCVVSIDYLTQPLSVLSSLRTLMRPRGKVHLAISNRCFYTKVVGRWLRISEEERVKMVADYLHFAGWKKVEMVEVVKADDGGMRGGTDPLWVVRAEKGEE